MAAMHGHGVAVPMGAVAKISGAKQGPEGRSCAALACLHKSSVTGWVGGKPAKLLSHRAGEEFGGGSLGLPEKRGWCPLVGLLLPALVFGCALTLQR